MKKHFAFAAALSAVILAACDSKKETPPAPTSSTPAPKAESATPPAPPAPPVDPAAAALAAFKAKVQAIDAFMDKNEELMNANPADGARIMETLRTKLADVSVDGLPQDLAKPFSGLRDLTGKMLDFMKTLPVDKMADQAAMQAWVAEQMQKDPEFMTKFQKTMGDIQKVAAEGDVLKDELKAAGKKYGIDLNLGKKKAAEATAPPAPGAPAPAPAPVTTPAAPTPAAPAAPAPGAPATN